MPAPWSSSTWSCSTTDSSRPHPPPLTRPRPTAHCSPPLAAPAAPAALPGLLRAAVRPGPLPVVTTGSRRSRCHLSSRTPPPPPLLPSPRPPPPLAPRRKLAAAARCSSSRPVTAAARARLAMRGTSGPSARLSLPPAPPPPARPAAAARGEEEDLLLPGPHTQSTCVHCRRCWWLTCLSPSSWSLQRPGLLLPRVPVCSCWSYLSA